MSAQSATEANLMKRFRDRLTYADTSKPRTAAYVRKWIASPKIEGAAEAHRFVNRVARKQRFMRIQYQHRSCAGWGTATVWKKTKWLNTI